MADHLQFIPLSQKLSLHKNKKKRQGLTAQEIKRTFYDDQATGKVRPQKITDTIPDKYVIAARGYIASEALKINKEFESLQCETRVSKESVLFSDPKVLKEVEKNESMYLKSMFKKEKTTKKQAKEANA